MSVLAGVYKLHNRVNDMHSHKIRRDRGTSQLALCMLSNCIPRKLMKRMLTTDKRIGEWEMPMIDVLLNQASLTSRLMSIKKKYEIVRHNQMSDDQRDQCYLSYYFIKHNMI